MVVRTLFLTYKYASQQFLIHCVDSMSVYIMFVKILVCDFIEKCL